MYDWRKFLIFSFSFLMPPILWVAKKREIMEKSKLEGDSSYVADKDDAQRRVKSILTGSVNHDPKVKNYKQFHHK